jgi:hypothetical protein
MQEERMIQERYEYIESVVEKSQYKRERKYKKLAFMILKAYYKKVVKERALE